MENNYLNLKNIVLIMMVSFFGSHSNAQNDYVINAIPHQVYVATLPIQFTSDDTNSGLITLPFDFTYF
jgi:hypothetical protein